MRDTELYRQLLGLAPPWTVTRVELAVKEQRVDVWAGHAEGEPWPCPECGARLPLYDHTEEREWRHLDSCQFKTSLHARPPRVQCAEHGVRQVRLPWAEARARFTTLFERLAIEVLLETDVLGAARILGITWDEAWHLQERAVRRGQQAKAPRRVTHLGVDEKAAAKGHRCLTLVCDLKEATVEFIGDDRKQTSLDDYFTGLTGEQRNGIEAIALDMWEPYIQSIRAHVPNADAKMVFDRYHIMGYMGKADTIQRHLPNVLTFVTHRVTNAVSEGLNSKIQTIKKMAYGFRNLEHFKTAIYFHCGGLQLYPVTHSIAG